MALYAAEGIVIASMDLNEPMAALFLTDEAGPLPCRSPLRPAESGPRPLPALSATSGGASAYRP
jgi:hypothetical protein